MDKDLAEKLRLIGTWERAGPQRKMGTFSLSFPEDDDGVVQITSRKGTIVHRLKPLAELYAEDSQEPKSVDEQLPLLHALESAIKRFSLDHPELSDSSVILVLEQLSAKPETERNDALLRAITLALRFQVSAQSYSREDVRRAIRKVLASAKRHQRAGGRRGYLEFICQYVP